MPSKSKKQARFMAAVAHSRKFAKKAGVPQSVGKEFNRADKRKRKAKDQAMGKFAQDEIKHHPSNGQFSSGGSADQARAAATHHEKASDDHYHQRLKHEAEAKKGGPGGDAHAKAATAHWNATLNHSAASAVLAEHANRKEGKPSSNWGDVHYTSERASELSQKANRSGKRAWGYSKRLGAA